MLSAVKKKKPGKDEGGPEKGHYNSKTRFSDGFTEKILFKQRLGENEGMSTGNIWSFTGRGLQFVQMPERGRLPWVSPQVGPNWQEEASWFRTLWATAWSLAFPLSTKRSHREFRTEE